MMDLMCDWNERVETSGDGQMEQLSPSRRRSPTFRSSALEATTCSVLSLLSLRRLVVAQTMYVHNSSGY